MLKIGTAKIITQANFTLVEYVNRTSFLRGEQMFLTQNEAVRFCRDRGLRVV
jgi:hypothetical protein